jgi:hypothetical protein
MTMLDEWQATRQRLADADRQRELDERQRRFEDQQLLDNPPPASSPHFRRWLDLVMPMDAPEPSQPAAPPEPAPAPQPQRNASMDAVNQKAWDDWCRAHIEIVVQELVDEVQELVDEIGASEAELERSLRAEIAELREQITELRQGEQRGGEPFLIPDWRHDDARH